LLVSLMLTGVLSASDWPHWGGPNTDFKIHDAGVIRPGEDHALKVVWKKKLGAGYSSVSVAGNVAVTMYSDGSLDYVVALNADDGAERWRHTIGPAYLGHWGSQNGPLSTPLITKNAVIAFTPVAA
jgi:hypothetical protein